MPYPQTIYDVYPDEQGIYGLPDNNIRSDEDIIRQALEQILNLPPASVVDQDTSRVPPSAGHPKAPPSLMFWKDPEYQRPLIEDLPARSKESYSEMSALPPIPSSLLSGDVDSYLENLRQKQVGKHVAWVLGWLQSPQYAAGSAIKYGLTGRNPLEGLKKGFTQEDITEPADLLGIDEVDPEASLPTRAAQTAVRLGPNMALDPLNLVGATGAGRKALNAAGWQKFLEWYGGTGLGRATSHHLAEPFKDVELLAQAAQRGRAADVRMESGEQLANLRKFLDDYFAGHEGAIREAYGGENVKPAWMWDQYRQIERPLVETGTIPSEVVEQYKPALRLNRQTQEAIDEAAQALGLTPRPPINDALSNPEEVPYYQWLPRVGKQSYHGESRGGPAPTLRLNTTDVSDPESLSRELMLWVDPKSVATGELRPLVRPLGIPKVGKLDDPRTGIVQRGEKYYQQIAGGEEQVYIPGYTRKDGRKVEGYSRRYRKEDYEREAAPVQASLEDIMEALPETGERFLKDPRLVLESDFAKKANRLEFLDFFKGLQDIPHPHVTDEAGNALPMVIDASRLEALPHWYRRSNIPGFENYAMPKNVANWVENKAHTAYDSNTYLGGLMDAIGAWNRSLPGKAYGAANQAWVRTVLGFFHPSFFGANYISDAQLLGMAQPGALGEIPRAVGAQVKHALSQSARESAQELGGKIPATDVIPGMSMEDALREGNRRNIFSTSFWDTIKSDEVREATKPKYLDALAELLPGPVESGLKRTTKAVHDINDWFFEHVGGPQNDNTKIALWSDQIKRAHAAGEEITPRKLDEIALFVKNAMIDYGAATPFETQGLKRNVLPFYLFYREAAPLLGKYVVDHPERLAQLSRLLDAGLTPPTPDERAAMKPWQKGIMSARGLLGSQWSSDKGLPQIIPTSRFSPFGFVEESGGRPEEIALSLTSPFPKLPIEWYLNKVLKTGFDIDPKAGGPVGGLINPWVELFTGEPTKWSPAWQRRFGQVVPAYYDYLLSAVNPFGRTIGEVSELARSTGIGALGDPKAQERGPLATALWYLVGPKLQSFDPEYGQRGVDRALMRGVGTTKALIRAMERRGDTEVADHFRRLLEMEQSDPEFLAASGRLKGRPRVNAVAAEDTTPTLEIEPDLDPQEIAAKQREAEAAQIAEAERLRLLHNEHNRRYRERKRQRLIEEAERKRQKEEQTVQQQIRGAGMTE